MADLATLADLKAYLGIANTTSDVLLQRMLTAGSACVETHLGRGPLQSAEAVEIYDGPATNCLLLRRWPVTAVAKVEFGGVTLTTPADTTRWPPTSGFALEPASAGVMHQRLFLYGYAFPAGRAAVRVTYTAGYASIPADIAQAVIETVATDYQRKDRLGLISKSIGGQETITYSQKALSDSSKVALAPYRNTAPI